MNLRIYNYFEVLFLDRSLILPAVGEEKCIELYYKDLVFVKTYNPFEYNIILTDNNDECYIISYGNDEKQRDTEYKILMERKKELENVRDKG